MSQAAAQILAKGPLSTALGQWMFLGFGTFVVFTGDNGVSKAAQEIASIAFRLATGRDGLPGASALFKEAALGNSAVNNAMQQQPQQPIIIHSHSSDSKSSSGSGGWTATVIQLGLASGACWGAYIIFSNFLPDQIKEMLPVTRKFFESAVTSLGQGILRVRDALSEQLAILGLKQEELAQKQDETHDQVLGIKDDIGDVRLQVDEVGLAITRCESSLADAAGRQTYMSQGVRLLVQCVGDLMRGSHPSVAAELDQFSRLSSELMDDDFHYTEGQNGKGGTPGKGGRQLEYPSSPNLSEIGSTTSTVIHDENMRTMSLPRPRRGQSIVTTVPSSTSKLVGSSPFAPGALKMLHSFRSNSNVGGNTTATTASSASTMTRTYSTPENEVPASNYYDQFPIPSGSQTPYGSDATDPVKLEDVDELLRIVRSGGNPMRV